MNPYQDQPGQLYLGQRLDDAGGKATGERLTLEARDLTTHAVVLGMTGSGKTGLGIILLEEALLSGLPCLILDPKGDITNLALTFPELRPADFEPWIDAGQAERAGRSPAEEAAVVAERWREGLAGSGIDGDRLTRLRQGSRCSIFTPGSSAGLPLNVLGSLAAPSGPVDDEALRDEIASFVSSLLGLAGIEADPITSREHILLSNLIDRAWQAGQDLDLASLIGQVQAPPLRKLGVFEVDSFFPEKDRTDLAMRLNGLVASPAFADWIQGLPLDIQTLLRTEDGRPRASIVYLAHLSEAERQLVVTLVLSKLITWMRGQSGSTDLRALVYMDEVYGYAPPTAAPPSKKPILTLLKQGRAFGVGMVLATQNPVDLDYKAMSNAGTWCIGRLQTERDKERVLEGLRSAAGGVDVAALDRGIGALDKRQFLLHSSHLDGPAYFATRWAMSYLRGPLTRPQIEQLTRDAPERDAIEAAARAAARSATRSAAVDSTSDGGPESARGSAVDAGQALAEDESQLMPEIASNVRVRHLSPSAPWVAEVGAVPGGRRLQAGLAARVHMRFDERGADLDHQQEWEAVFFPLAQRFDASTGLDVDHDERDFVDEAPAGAVYVMPEAKLHTLTYFRDVETAIRAELYRNRELELWHNPELKLYSRPGEARADFELRCVSAADDAADADAAGLRETIEKRVDRLEDTLRNAQLRVQELEVDVDQRRGQELMAGAGDLIGALLGGRGAASKVARAARSMRSLSSRRSMTVRTRERLESAADKRDAKVEQIEALEEELREELIAIDDKWRQAAGRIERLEIGLERNDIDVDQLTLVWIPTE